MQIQEIRLLGKDLLTGIADPEQELLEVDLLLSHITGLSRASVLANPGATLQPQAVTDLLALFERRKTHEPIAYLTGHKEFFGFDFEVSPDVLIPRPDTELLVELLLSRVIPLCEDSQPFSVIDIGTGSGAILLALGRTLGERFGEGVLASVKLVGVDRSQEALQVAARNAASLELLPYVLFGPSDLLTVFEGGKINALSRPIQFVANLPYIPIDEVLPPSVGEFEPTIALRGGADGLDIIRRCIRQWSALARPDEPLFLEVGQGEAATLISEFSTEFGITVHRDLREIERVVELVKLAGERTGGEGTSD